MAAVIPASRKQSKNAPADRIVFSLAIVIGAMKKKCKKDKMRKIPVDLSEYIIYKINKVLFVLFGGVVCD